MRRALSVMFVIGIVCSFPRFVSAYQSASSGAASESGRRLSRTNAASFTLDQPVRLGRRDCLGLRVDTHHIDSRGDRAPVALLNPNGGGAATVKHARRIVPLVLALSPCRHAPSVPLTAPPRAPQRSRLT